MTAGRQGGRAESRGGKAPVPPPRWGAHKGGESMDDRLVELQAEKWIKLAEKLEKDVKAERYEDVKVELKIAARTWRRAATQLLQLLDKQR